MNFTYPMAFIGLISIPLIVLFYFFKQKYIEVKVPSLYLWEKSLSVSEAQKPWQKLRSNLLMILQIIAAFLLVLILSEPYWVGGKAVFDYIIVVDQSMSMQATDVKPSRFDAAKASAKKVIEGLEPGAKVSIIGLSNEPYILVANSDDKTTLISRLNAMKVTNSPGNAAVTAELVKTLDSDGTSLVYSFSDTAQNWEGVNVNNLVIGESVDNCAITMLSHSFDADRIISLVKVKNYSAGRSKKNVSLFADEKIVDVKEIILEPHEERDVFFTNVQLSTSNIVARLSETDYLEIDDSAYDCVYGDITRKSILFTEQNVFLENVLSILPNIELFKGSPDEMSNLSGYYLYIFDGVLPEVMPIDGHILIFNPPADSTFVEVNGEFEVSSIEQVDMSLMSFLKEMNFLIMKAKAVTLPEWGMTALGDGDYPLIFTGSKGSQKIAVFTFDLHDTDLPLKKEFPIFMFNLSQWFMPTYAVSNEKALAGKPIELNPHPSSTSIRIVLPSNTIIKVAPPFPVSVFTETNEPGIYIMEQDIAGSSQYLNFAVNVETGDESDLIRSEVLPDEFNESAAKSMANRSFNDILIILLLLVLGVEWWVYSRGI